MYMYMFLYMHMFLYMYMYMYTHQPAQTDATHLLQVLKDHALTCLNTQSHFSSLGCLHPWITH